MGALLFLQTLKICNAKKKHVFYFLNAKVVMTASPCEPSLYDENINGFIEKKEIEHIFNGKEEETEVHSLLFLIMSIKSTVDLIDRKKHNAFRR